VPYNLDKKYNKKKEQGIIDLIGNLLLPTYRLSYIIYNTRTLRLELRIWSLEFPILPIKLCSFFLAILFSSIPLNRTKVLPNFTGEQDKSTQTWTENLKFEASYFAN
jgi:hypothetical protein